MGDFAGEKVIHALPRSIRVNLTARRDDVRTHSTHVSDSFDQHVFLGWCDAIDIEVECPSGECATVLVPELLFPLYTT